MSEKEFVMFHHFHSISPIHPSCKIKKKDLFNVFIATLTDFIAVIHVFECYSLKG